MRFLLLCGFMFLLVEAPLHSQILITKNQMPIPDSVYNYTRAFPTGISYADTGPDFIWDYSDLNNLSATTLTMDAPSHTPLVYQLVFNNPIFANNNSTHAQPGIEINLPASFGFSLTDVFNFYKNSNTAFTLVGIGATINGIQTPIPYQIKDKIYQFPLEYGDIDTSTFLFDISIPSIGGWKQGGTRINAVDGWGTILLPGNQSYEVLRVKTSLTLRDTIRFESGGITLPVTRKQFEYKFLTLGSEFPVLQINTQLLFLSSGPQIVQSVIYKEAPPSTASINDEEDNGLIVFPNPVDDVLHIQCSDHCIGYAIFDLQGKIWSNGAVQADISIKHLSTGIYILRLFLDNGRTMSKKFIRNE
ncbi:MAG: T9SS type A sorting domain-containing protein [Flavobacteriales bacterium]|nr:T9SS type A sorting domain-containing protein [Flavobacteriales bacterium]